jgi:hypothetical protein
MHARVSGWVGVRVRSLPQAAEAAEREERRMATLRIQAFARGAKIRRAVAAGVSRPPHARRRCGLRHTRCRSALLALRYT